MSEKMTQGVQFHETLAADWSSGYLSGGFQRRFGVLQAALKPIVKTDAKWLDAGCGSGVLARELFAMGAVVTGADASPKMLELARRESWTEGDSISYQHLHTIEDLPYSSGEFDGVLCSSVVEYIDSPARAFREFARVLKAGGNLVVTAPNTRSAVRAFQKLGNTLTGLWGETAFSYLEVSKQTFTPAQLADNLRAVGIQVEDCDLFDPLLPGPIARAGVGSLIVALGQKIKGD